MVVLDYLLELVRAVVTRLEHHVSSGSPYFVSLDFACRDTPLRELGHCQGASSSTATEALFPVVLHFHEIIDRCPDHHPRFFHHTAGPSYVAGVMVCETLFCPHA